MLSKYIQDIRDELPTEQWGELNALDTKVRSHEPENSAQVLVHMSKTEMDAFEQKLQDSELGLSENTRMIIRKMSESVTKTLCRALMETSSKEEDFLEEISERLYEITYKMSKEQDEAAQEAQESLNHSRFPELRKEHLLRLRKEDLVHMFMKRDEAREKQTDFEREQIDRCEERIEEVTKQRDASEQRYLNREEEMDRRMREQVKTIKERYEKRLEEEIQSRALQQQPDPVWRETQVSEILQPFELAPPPQIEPDRLVQPIEDPDAVAAAASKAADATRRQEARKEVQETLFNLDKMMQLSRAFIGRHTGVGSSGPSSVRTRLSITSSSSSRNNPVRSNTSDNGARMPKMGQGTLQDELDFDSLPSTQSVADAGSSSGPVQPAHGTHPPQVQQQQGLGVDQDFFEEELAGDEIGNPTPSTLALNILARFVEVSSLTPSRIYLLVDRLVQSGKINKNSTSIQPSLRRLEGAARQMQNEKPMALTEEQLERASISVIEAWIADLEPYLNRFIELLLDRTEDLTTAVADEEKLQQRQRQQQEEVAAEVEEVDENEAEQQREEEKQDQKHTEASTSKHADASPLGNVSSRGSGSASSERKLRFADRERQPSRPKHPRPAQLDLSLAGSTASDDAAKRPLTPHPSTTKSKSGSSSNGPSQASPLKKSKAVSPVSEVPDREYVFAPNVPGPTTVQAAPASRPAPALWRQLLNLLYGLIRWLTWGQLDNLWMILTFIPLLLKYCWYSLQHELASGILTPDLQRHSLRPLRAPKIPASAASSLCLWVLLIWNAAMLVSMEEERRLWLAANPRTASYLRGLSSRYPYPRWSPVEVDYGLLEPAWAGFSVWLHEAYFGNGLIASIEVNDTGHAPAVMKSGLNYLAQGAKVTLMQVGIEHCQDIPRVL